MAKNSGSTRTRGASAPVGGAGGYTSSRYARGVQGFDSEEEASAHLRRMNEDLQGFAEREGLDYSGGIFRGASIETDGNIRRIHLSVETNMAARPNKVALFYELRLGEWKSPLYGSKDFDKYQELAQNLNGKRFETLEEAYAYAKREIERANKMNIG